MRIIMGMHKSSFYPVVLVLAICFFDVGQSFQREMHCKKEVPEIGDGFHNFKRPFQSFIHGLESRRLEEEPDQYNLSVTNTGPAVFGSHIYFNAEILNKNGQVGDFKEFIYIWMNDADDGEYKMSDDFNATYHTYFYDDKEPKIYMMKVCVYDKLQSSKGGFKHIRVAQGTTYFKLTDTLNGELKSHQDLPHLVKNNIYETNEIVHVKVNLTDRFLYKRQNDYLWKFRHGEQEIRIPTKNPEVTYNSSIVGQHSLELSVTSIPIEPPEEPYFETVYGNFKHNFILKDGVSSAGIEFEDRHDTGFVPVGENVVINVTYNGSNPTFVCWSIEFDLNNVNETTEENCSKPITGKNHSYVFNIELKHTGAQFINVSIHNDVSEFLQKKVLYGYVPGPGGSVSVAIPVVFSILGILVIFFSALYIVRYKRSHTVEVADFDFHPSLHHGDTHPYIGAVKNKLYKLFSRDKFSDNLSHVPYRETTAKNYGSLSTSQELEYL